jgi:hypothetical protein
MGGSQSRPLLREIAPGVINISVRGRIKQENPLYQDLIFRPVLNRTAGLEAMLRMARNACSPALAITAGTTSHPSDLITAWRDLMGTTSIMAFPRQRDYAHARRVLPHAAGRPRRGRARRPWPSPWP